MKYLNVVAFDDDKKITQQFSDLLAEDGFKVLQVNNADDLSKLLDSSEIMNEAAALIFDLAQSKEEADTAKNFKITEKIQLNFDKWRVPIFIHSGFASAYEHFKDCGTVWKMEKSGTSIEDVCKLITLLSEAGFNETFGSGGVIEKTILSDLHSAFVGQFRNGEIEKIITAYSTAEKEKSREKLIDIFKRTAVRSVMSELVSPEVIVNPTEIYYRRTNKLDFWTGDVFESNDGTEMVMIMTPRCDLASKDGDLLLVCVIENDFPQTSKEKIQYALTNNPKFAESTFRYLPPTPIFRGGRVNLTKHKTVVRTEFKAKYTRLLSLSDDITNEILGKFSSYFLRTGINPINLEDVRAYFETLKEPDAAKK